jgi:hypothetical protein
MTLASHDDLKKLGNHIIQRPAYYHTAEYIDFFRSWAITLDERSKTLLPSWSSSKSMTVEEEKKEEKAAVEEEKKEDNDPTAATTAATVAAVNKLFSSQSSSLNNISSPTLSQQLQQPVFTTGKASDIPLGRSNLPSSNKNRDVISMKPTQMIPTAAKDKGEKPAAGDRSYSSKRKKQ